MPPKISWRRIEWVVIFAAPLVFTLLTQAIMSYMSFAPVPHRLAVLAVLGIACSFALWTFVSRAIRTHLTAVESRNKLLATAVAEMHEGVLIFEEDGTILYANASVIGFFGLPSGQLTGQTVYRLMEMAGVPGGRQFLLNLPPEGWRGELNLRDGQGRSRIIRGWTTSVTGGIWLAVLRDVTRERRLETESRRTAELTGILKAVRTVNHEINNPLFVILASLEMIESKITGADERTLTRFRNIQEAAHRIEEVTQNLSQIVRTATTDYSLPSPHPDASETPANELHDL